MGPRLIIPIGKQNKLTQERFAPIRRKQQPCAAFFQGQDESLHDGNAAVLTDRAESRLDALLLAPCPETVVPELDALIGHKVLRRGARRADGQGPLSWSSDL